MPSLNNRVVIDLKSKDLSTLITDERNIPHRVSSGKQTASYMVGVALIALFTLISVAQMTEWKPLDYFLAFQDIQRNFNNWSSLLADYQALESNKIKTLTPLMTNYNNIVCIDYGTFYLPMLFNNIILNNTSILLPAAVRRGNGDAWAVTKSASKDPAALQQCLYVASEYSDSIITCGMDMYSKIGYGGFLNKGHWCNNAKDLLYKQYKI